MGRKSLPDRERRVERMAFGFTASEMGLIRCAAGAVGMKSRLWAMGVVLAAAKGAVADGASVECAESPHIPQRADGCPGVCLDDDLALVYLESCRWSESGVRCVKCGDVDVYPMKSSDGSREEHMRWSCRSCRAMYTVRGGSFLAGSRVPLRHWLWMIWADGHFGAGARAGEIQLNTGVSRKTALSMLDRYRSLGDLGEDCGFDLGVIRDGLVGMEIVDVTGDDVFF